MTIWKPTNRDRDKLFRDIKNNGYRKTYYAICEVAVDGGVEHMYREIVFKKSLVWGANWHHLSYEAVLSNYGPIHDTPPVGMRPLFGAVAQYPPVDENGNRIKYDEKHCTSEKATAAAR